MNNIRCSSQGPEQCAVDYRREAARRSGNLAGLDYVEVYPDRVTLCVHFFGDLPPLAAENIRIEGGRRIRDIRVLRAEFHRHEDGDTCLRVTVDRSGDRSRYCLCLVAVEPPPADDCPPPPCAPAPTETTGAGRKASRDGRQQQEAAAVACSFDPSPPPPLRRPVPEGIDPRYACVDFVFHLDCDNDADCEGDACGCRPSARLPAPAIDYLARDFTSFKRMMLDRMSITMPQWRERHIPDIGVTLVELLAYVADQYSYTLDAVATEAYLGTAQHRISVRRHARLLDYALHEGCNARAWISLEVGHDLLDMELRGLRFATLPVVAGNVFAGLVEWERMQPEQGMVVFEPIDLRGDGKVDLHRAHGTIAFHRRGNEDCCLPAGATRATLVDAYVVRGDDEQARQLKLRPGDVLILEEIRGAHSGHPADADRSKRHAVRLTRTEENVDPLDGKPLLEIEWDARDALPFPLCLSARTRAPECHWVEVAVARGNVLLVDHGMTVEEEDERWEVGGESVPGCCECDGSVADAGVAALPLRIVLSRTRITQRVAAAPGQAPARSLLTQDPRQALPALVLDMAPASPGNAPWSDRYDWQAVADLLRSGPVDRHLVAEFDDDGHAHLRFGDDEAGRRPRAGERFRARYRIGNGLAGNVGAEAIVAMAVRGHDFSDLELSVRNPLPASGGVDPEPVADAKRYAPHAYGRAAERAVVGGDYAEIAAADVELDGAHAGLAWTGSGYEAVVALDPLAASAGDADLPARVMARLERVRRIGHDLRCVPVREVPLAISIMVCVQPGALRAEVAAAVAALLSSRRQCDGRQGLFHPDRLSFGQDVMLSPLIAAVQALDGVQHVTVTEFRRADADGAAAEKSLEEGSVDIAADEIAVLDADPGFSERGTLTLKVEGGR